MATKYKATQIENAANKQSTSDGYYHLLQLYNSLHQQNPLYQYPDSMIFLNIKSVAVILHRKFSVRGTLATRIS